MNTTPVIALSLVLVVGVVAARAGAASRWSPRLAGLALGVAVAGGAAARAAGGGRRAVALGALALFSLAIAELGREPARARS
jgi:hypothetical protein